SERNVEESEDTDTSGARSTSSDSNAPLLPDHPLTHTSPTLVPFLRRTARMAMCVLPLTLPGLSASIAEVAAMSDSTFRKRFRPSYATLPSSSPDLPSWKHSQGTSKLVEDDEEEEDAKDEDDKEEDKEVKESLDSDSESEDAEDDDPTAEDECPAIGDEGPAIADEGLATWNEGLGMRVESLGLGEDEAVLREIASREGQMPSVYVVGQGSGFVPEPERPERVLALRHPTLTTWIDLEDGRAYIDVPTYPPTAQPELELEQKRVAMTFGAIWRLVLALESWAGQMDAQRAAL
nr:hypothetical protein [Tanacetum cinerariifolium]